MVRLPAGSYLPLYGAPTSSGVRSRSRVTVASFDMDARAVTNAEYLQFVVAHPEWRRSRVKAVYADSGYLRHWAGDLSLGDGVKADSPVVNVSWFAARAYLHAAGKELATVDQWEYVEATRRGPQHPSRRLAGISDQPGVFWEWTLDFNSSLLTDESCGGSAADALDLRDYGAFMRYAFRSSLEARYTVGSLGFRGVIANQEQP